MIDTRVEVRSEGSERGAGIDAAWEDRHEIVKCDIAWIERNPRGRCPWTIWEGIGGAVNRGVLHKVWLAGGRLVATPERIRAQGCFSATHGSRSGDGV